MAKVFFGFKLEPFDQARLKRLAAQRGKRPATLVRQTIEKMLDAAEVAQSSERKTAA